MSFNDRIRAALRYDPESGKLFWLPRERGAFTTEKSFKAWNVRFAGKEAGWASAEGYICIRFEGKNHKAHRIAWFLFSGEWPTEIDHSDGDGFNNRKSNLIDGSHRENMRNKSVYRNNKSGYPGVVWEKKKRLWAARMPVDGKLKTLGRSKDLDKAIALKKAAEVAHGFSHNHGRAAA